MKIRDSYYDNKVVLKPWGYEYSLLRIKNKVLIKFLNIKYKKQTSLHSHPTKKNWIYYFEWKSNGSIWNI